MRSDRFRNVILWTQKDNIRTFDIRDSDIAGLHRRAMDNTRQTSSAYHRRDQAMVFILCNDIRTGNLSEMGL